MTLNNPFAVLGDFLKLITGQPLTTTTSTVGGGADTGNKMPWYVIPALVIVIAIILIKVGTAAGNKLVEKI